MNKKVRVNKQYKYNPVFFDRVISPPMKELKSGDIVKVVNKYGCPKANTMGMCYVEKDGQFMGMVCTNSLEEI